MATNHTTNYELSQWRSDDQVLRADFNADNVKLDAALANLAQELDLRAKTRTVLRQVMGEGESGVSFSAQVGEVDWTVWRCVHLVFTPVYSTPLAYEMTFSYDKGSVSSETLSGPLHAAFWPLGSGEQNTHGLTVDHGVVHIVAVGAGAIYTGALVAHHEDDVVGAALLVGVHQNHHAGHAPAVHIVDHVGGGGHVHIGHVVITHIGAELVVVLLREGRSEERSVGKECRYG